jgi:hypothetical protein
MASFTTHPRASIDPGAAGPPHQQRPGRRVQPEPPGPARSELPRPQREARRLVTVGGGTQFHPGHGEWIAILRASGFAIDDLCEIYAPPDAADHPYYQLATADWARRWPVEEIWTAHLEQ